MEWGWMIRQLDRQIDYALQIPLSQPRSLLPHEVCRWFYYRGLRVEEHGGKEEGHEVQRALVAAGRNRGIWNEGQAVLDS